MPWVAASSNIYDVLPCRATTTTISNFIHQHLKCTILDKIHAFNVRSYLYDCIASTSLIIAVPPSSLPRTATKGYIRQQTEDIVYLALLVQSYQDVKVIG